jgi:uncharacterized protein (DUF924 family)
MLKSYHWHMSGSTGRCAAVAGANLPFSDLWRVRPGIFRAGVNSDQRNKTMMRNKFSVFAREWGAEPVPRQDHHLQARLAKRSKGAVPPSANAQTDAQDVVSFWEAAGPKMWFAKDPGFDLAFRDRFITSHDAALRGDLNSWATTAQGALALILLLDQFPRNAFRGSARMYAADPLARLVADIAIGVGHDQSVDPALRMFFYLPFAHSEEAEDQDRSVALFRPLPPPGPEHSVRHRDIIRRFGRFPHRNVILGRQTSPEEAEFLNSGGYAG